MWSGISSGIIYIDDDIYEYSLSSFLRIALFNVKTSDYRYMIESYKNLFM